MLSSLELIMKANRYKIWNDELRPRVNFYKKNTHRQFHSNSMAGKRKPLTSLDRCLPSIFPATFAPIKKTKPNFILWQWSPSLLTRRESSKSGFDRNHYTLTLCFYFHFISPFSPNFPSRPHRLLSPPPKVGRSTCAKRTHARSMLRPNTKKANTSRPPATNAKNQQPSGAHFESDSQRLDYCSVIETWLCEVERATPAEMGWNFCRRSENSR